MTPEIPPSTPTSAPRAPSDSGSSSASDFTAAKPAPQPDAGTITDASTVETGQTAYEPPTWEDDETPATSILRALFALLSTGFLAYAQWKAPASWIGTIGQNWGKWVWMSAVCNFILPLAIVWLFFGQGLTRQTWLKDQKHNAWNYGWNWSQWKRHLRIALGCWAVLLPFLIYFSRNPAMRAAYADYLPPVAGLKDWAFLLSTLVLYMFCWEWFFRGFALFGMAQGFGAWPAIALQAVIFGAAHWGKVPPDQPQIEMWSAFAGGLVLGTLSWREKSFLPAFLIHALIHVSWAILILL